MPDSEDSDLGPRLALRAVRNLRRPRQPGEPSRAWRWFLPAVWVMVSVTILAQVVDIGLDAWRTANPPQPRPLFVCVEFDLSDGMASRTGEDPCWAGVPDAR